MSCAHSARMTESEYIDLIDSLWPKLDGSPSHGEGASPEALAASAEAVAAFPLSAELHCLRGDLLLTRALELPEALEAARRHLLEATRLDPGFVDAWESLGFLYDVHFEDNERNAEEAFRNGIAAGGTNWTYAGLAIVLTESGRKAEALALLKQGEAVWPGDELISETRSDIEKGIWDADA